MMEASSRGPGNARSSTFTGTVLVDAHVHLHPGCNPGKFLAAASDNFKRARQELSISAESYLGVICLTECPDEMAFDRVDRWMSGGSGDWQARPTADVTSLLAESPKNDRILIVAGRQIRTREGLEVLALGTDYPFVEDLPADTVIEEIENKSGLAVVPWGFGKWSGARRRVLRNLMLKEAGAAFHLGDSANRPSFWRESDIWNLARGRQIRNLPGSDPLPLGRECNRAGSHGFAIDCTLDMNEPTRSLLANLADSRLEVRPFGRPETTVRFIRNQIGMQIRRIRT